MTAKTKVLSLALLGLAGFGFAGSALAGCPASPVPPWTAVFQLGGTATITAGGYAGTPCRLDAALTGDITSIAAVEDDSPSAEPRYRVQFIIDADNLTNLGVVDAVGVFSAQQAGGLTSPITLGVVGDGVGGLGITYVVQNPADPSGVSSGYQALTAGPNYVEFDYDTGAVSGTPHFSLWVNNNVEATPTVSVTTFSNTQTIDTAFLGLANAFPGFVTNQNGHTVGLDQFDSRRATFMGF